MSEHSREIRHSRLTAIALLATVLIAIWLYTDRTRYSMIQSGTKAYKYDRITGELWLVVDSRYGPVDGPVNFADQ